MKNNDVLIVRFFCENVISLLECLCIYIGVMYD